MPRPSAPPAGTATLEGVELVKLGTWAASTGVTNITHEDLEAMVAASLDPEVDRAAVRIGHIDPRFDGEPALGWVERLRIVGDVLVGDLVGVPSKLSAVLPAAFRRRSVEIAWGARTPSGKRYRAALTGLALLGVQAPAVRGLADVLALYSAGELAPQQVRTYTGREDAGDVPAGSIAADRTAALSVADDLDASPELVAATFAAHRAIDLLASATDASPEAIDALRSTVDGLAAAVPPAHDPDERTEEDEPMPVTDERIRELLGLEEDADVEAAIVELRNRPAASGDGGGSGDGGTDPAPTTEPAEPTTEPTTEPAGDPAEPELVTLSRGNLDALTAQATEGAEARRILREQERERVLTSALSSGRIAPADRERWAAALERDHEGTVSLLSNLTPVVPTTELGSDRADDLAAGVPDETWDAFEREVLGVDPSALTREG